VFSSLKLFFLPKITAELSNLTIYFWPCLWVVDNALFLVFYWIVACLRIEWENLLLYIQFLSSAVVLNLFLSEWWWAILTFVGSSSFQIFAHRNPGWIWALWFAVCQVLARTWINMNPFNIPCLNRVVSTLPSFRRGTTHMKKNKKKTHAISRLIRTPYFDMLFRTLNPTALRCLSSSMSTLWNSKK
jgi:hypothetical protein